MWRGWRARWRKIYPCTGAPIQINRLCKLFHSSTVNTIGVTHNATVSLTTNSLTIFVPSAFYLISWCCCSKEKSSGELHSSHQTKTYCSTTAVYDVFNSVSNYVTVPKNIWRKWRLCLLWRGILLTLIIQLRNQVMFPVPARFEVCVGGRSPPPSNESIISFP